MASRVYGTDIIEPEMVSNVDHYICIDTGSKAPLSDLPDGSVDAILALNYCGFHTHSTWRRYFSAANERLAVYLEPQNFPRILPPGDFLIFSEWEAALEARWGKASLAEIERDASSKYDPPEMTGFRIGHVRLCESNALAIRCLSSHLMPIVFFAGRLSIDWCGE